MRLRTSDPAYLAHVDRWWAALFPRMRRFLVQHGGPILMVQASRGRPWLPGRCLGGRPVMAGQAIGVGGWGGLLRSISQVARQEMLLQGVSAATPHTHLFNLACPGGE